MGEEEEGEGQGCTKRERTHVLAAPKPQVYIGGRGGCAPFRVSHPKGCGQGGRSASQVKWRPPPLGFPLPMRMGLGGAGAPGPLRLGRPLTAHAAVLDVVEHFPDLRTPPESSGTFWKLPGTIPKKPELFPEPEQQLSIYKSLPPDHSGTPRDVRDLIRDSEQHSVITYKSS